MPLLILLPLVVVAIIALVPISIVQRYRLGTSRQRARGWLAVVNLTGLALSAVAFLIGAAFTDLWVPHSLRYSVEGLGIGIALGVIGLWLTRWEHGRDALHYTPNRLLVLAVTLVVTARIAYGFWRALHAWHTGMADETWWGVSGIAGSMAAGAIVLGYYLAYWAGVRRKYRRHLARS